MVRRFAQVSLAIFLVLALATVASAASNVANTTQKGALLVFPKVQCYSTSPTSTACDLANTYFFLNNDYVKGTYVKCYWMDNNQSVEDFHFYLTANQPIVFSAGDNPYGPPFGDNRAGSLVCWAQDEWDAKPADVGGAKGWNHLYGYAMLTSTAADVDVFYNAYSFYLRDFLTAVNAVEGGWQLNLNGTAFDACPQYLITSLLPAVDVQGGNPGNPAPVAQPLGGNPDLALWPCKQDLRQDRSPTCTKAKFDIWDYNEYKYTGSYQCFKCFFEGFLHKVGDKKGFYGDDGAWVYKRGPGFGGEKFLRDTLGYDPSGTEGGKYTPARLRVTGVKSDKVCITNGFTGTKYDKITCTETVASGLLGVLVYGYPLAGWVKTADGTAPGINPVAAHTLFGAGLANTAETGGPGWVKYDGSGQVVPEAPGR